MQTQGRQKNKAAVSKALSTSWSFLSESFLLEWPVMSIMITTGICLALASRLADINIVYSTRNTLGTGDGESRRDEFDAAQLFPSRPRFSRLLFTTLESDNESEGDDTNVLTKATFDEIWGVADKVARIEAGVENERYEALCYRHSANGQCVPYGVLSFWGGDEALYRITVADSQSLKIELSPETFLDGSPVPRDLVFGDYTLVKDEASNEEVMKYARGVVVTYALSENNGNAATILEWEQAFLRLAAETNLASCRMMWQATLSYETEQEAGVHGWGDHASKLTLGALAIASSCLLGEFPRAGMASTHTRIALGSIGVAFLVLSTAAAGGAMVLCGVPVSGLHLTLIALVCAAVGLKNMFGLCAEIDDAARDLPARGRVCSAASRWAPGAVLYTTISTMVMVVGGGTFSSSATKSFCAYAGAGILLGWITQVFGFIPCLLIDERRRDVGRRDVVCCVKTQHLDVIDGPTRLSGRRDSFVVQPLSGSTYRPTSAKGAVNTDEVWNDTGDELVLTPPCSPTSVNIDVMATKLLPRTPSSCANHPSNIPLEVSPYPSHSPGGFREGWNAREPDKKRGCDRPAAELDGIIRGNHQQLWGPPLTQDTGTENSNGRIGRFLRPIPSIYRSLSPNQSPGHFEVRDAGTTLLTRLQEAVLVKGDRGKRYVSGISGIMKAPVGGRDKQSGERGSGSGEGCVGAIIQGYCNWLLDGNGTRLQQWGVLSGFGVLLAAAFALGLKYGSPGYNVNDFYPRSSYLSDFVTTARRQRLLFGESSLPAAAYIQGVDLFEPAIQQAILDLETALVSSSPLTIGSTSSVEGDVIVHGNATSSWLRGFIDWLPSSPYASVDSGSGDEVDLWVSTPELFNNAVKEFLADPRYQRFEDDLSFENGIATGCRIWVRHLDFRGPTAVSTIAAAKEAISALGMEPDPFVFATEYVLAEHYASILRETLAFLVVAAVSTTVVGYVLLTNLAFVCILISASFAVQVEALAMVALLNAGDYGVNAHAIPSVLLAVALGTGSVGTMLKSFASQDCERSFHANLRISVVQTSGPVGSSSAVIAISVLALLLFSASSSSATFFVQAFGSATLWSVLLSLLHGLLLTPTLLLVLRDKLRPTPTIDPDEVRAETLPRWQPHAAPGETVELVGNGYAIAVGISGAVALLGDPNANNTNCSGGVISGQNHCAESRHLNEQRTDGSEGNPDLLPETELAIQAIGARAATQAAMMLPDTAVPVRGEQASPRIRGTSWGDM